MTEIRFCPGFKLRPNADPAMTLSERIVPFVAGSPVQVAGKTSAEVMASAGTTRSGTSIDVTVEESMASPRSISVARISTRCPPGWGIKVKAIAPTVNTKMMASPSLRIAVNEMRLVMPQVKAHSRSLAPERNGNCG